MRDANCGAQCAYAVAPRALVWQQPAGAVYIDRFQTNVPDRLFAALAAQGGMAEVELGKLAQQKSRNNAVTAFAKRMVDDHGNSTAQLAELAKQAGLLLPTEPGPDQLEVRQRLSALNGAVFDVEYTRAQVTDHQKTVQLLLWVIASGENADLQRFASGTLPDVVHHLQLAQTLLSQLTGAAARDELTSGALKGRHETSEP
jgi:putative membrane protein